MTEWPTVNESHLFRASEIGVDMCASESGVGMCANG